MTLKAVATLPEISPASDAYYAFDYKRAAALIAPFAPKVKVKTIEAILASGDADLIRELKMENSFPPMLIADAVKDSPLVLGVESLQLAF